MAGLILVFGILDFPFFMDVPGYVEQAERTLAGEVPNRDFQSPYGIGWVYLNAGMLWLTGSFWGMVALLQLAEMTGIALIARTLPFKTEDARARLFWLYVFNPISVNSLCLLTQDDALLILLLGVSVWTLDRGGKRLGPGVAVMGFHLTKLFSAWSLIPFVLGLPRRAFWRTVLTGIASLLLLLALGIQPIAFAFSRSGGTEDALTQRITNGNLWFLLSQVTEIPSVLPTGLVLTALGAAALWMLLRRDSMASVPSLLWGCALLTLMFQLGYQMSYPMYLAPALPGLLWCCLQHPGHLRWTALVGVSFLSPWLNPAYFRFFRTGEGGELFRFGFLMLDAVQVAGLMVLFVGLIRLKPEKGVSP
jgi:hypothetical protein